MKRVALIASSIAVLGAAIAQAAPDGVPARPRSIGRWYDHDPSAPQPGFEAWSPADAAGFLQLYPDAYLEVPFDDAKPPGLTKAQEVAGRVHALKSILSQRGVDASGRICMSGDRPDVLTRLADDNGPCNVRYGGGGCDWEGDMDGSHGEAESVVKVAGHVTAGTPTGLVDARSRWQTDLYHRRLLVLRPGSASEERRRVVTNDASSLTVDGVWRTPPRPGDLFEVRGSFDPAWVKRVSQSAHQDALQQFWPRVRNVCGSLPCAPPAESLDPFDSNNRRGWVPWADRGAIEALRTPSSVPALYGWVYDGGKTYRHGVRPEQWKDPYFVASSVVMDLANPSYREWHIRYLLYQLEDHGIEPGESTCILSAYKPGFHTYYSDQLNGPSGRPCSEGTTDNWVGPAQICKDGTSESGPLHPTPFAPGEYEAAISSYFREMTTTLAANGYSNLRIVTAEAPSYRDTIWSILAADVRRLAKMVGEQGGWIEPRLAVLASLPPPSARPPQTVAGDATDPAVPTSDTSASGTTGASDPTTPIANAPAESPASAPPIPREGGVVSASPGSGGSPTPSFSLGSGPTTGASASDTGHPATTATNPLAAENSPSPPSPTAASGADPGSAPPAARAASGGGESAAASKPSRHGYVTSSRGSGGGTIYAPSLNK